MAIHGVYKKRLAELNQRYQAVCAKKTALLSVINEVELPEGVYNSNAIENSTLTLDETEQILFEQTVGREVSVREVFEAKNLSQVMEYVWQHGSKKVLSNELIIFLHQSLLTKINDDIAGRFRQEHEYVRVGRYVAPAPEQVATLLDAAIARYQQSDGHYIDAIARFHLDFETIHPFVDGNGQIGRVLINFLLQQRILPPVIIRDAGKHLYYQSFKTFQSGDQTATTEFEHILTLALVQSFQKRLAYLEGKEIITLNEYAKRNQLSHSNLINKAHRQTVAAFIEKGVWKIGV